MRHTHAQTHAHIFIYTCMCIYMNICTYICIYIYIYIYIYMYMHKYIFTPGDRTSSPAQCLLSLSAHRHKHLRVGAYFLQYHLHYRWLQNQWILLERLCASFIWILSSYLQCFLQHFNLCFCVSKFTICIHIRPPPQRYTVYTAGGEITSLLSPFARIR